MIIADMIWKQIEPKFEESIERAYVKGGEDMARRMAYVFDIVRDKARAEGLADVGAIDIPEISAEEFDSLAEDGDNYGK